MNRALTNGRIVEAAPGFQTTITYVYYLLTIVTGVVVLVAGNRMNFLVDVVATAFYVALTALFYALTKERRHSA